MQSSHSNSSTSTFQEDIGTLGFLGEGLILIAAQQTCSDDDDPAREPSHGPQKIWFNLCHIYWIFLRRSLAGLMRFYLDKTYYCFCPLVGSCSNRDCFNNLVLLTDLSFNSLHQNTLPIYYNHRAS